MKQLPHAGVISITISTMYLSRFIRRFARFRGSKKQQWPNTVLQFCMVLPFESSFNVGFRLGSPTPKNKPIHIHQGMKTEDVRHGVDRNHLAVRKDRREENGIFLKVFFVSKHYLDSYFGGRCFWPMIELVRGCLWLAWGPPNSVSRSHPCRCWNDRWKLCCDYLWRFNESPNSTLYIDLWNTLWFVLRFCALDSITCPRKWGHVMLSFDWMVKEADKVTAKIELTLLRFTSA